MKSLLTLTIVSLLYLQTHAQSPKIVVFDAGESISGWNSSQPLTIDNTDFKEGKGALKTEGTGAFRFRKKLDVPFNTGLEGKHGYLCFWLYLSDASEVNDVPGILGISSSGKMELNAHHFQLKNLNLVKGWNKVTLQLTDASAEGGAFDDSKLNYFMLILHTKDSIVMKIDNIRFAKDNKDI